MTPIPKSAHHKRAHADSEKKNEPVPVKQVQNGHTPEPNNQHPLLLENLGERDARVHAEENHPRLLDHDLGEGVQTLVDPHEERGGVRAFEKEVVLRSVDLAEVQHLHRVDENVAGVVELGVSEVALHYEENDETVLVEVRIGLVCALHFADIITAQAESHNMMNEQFVEILLALVHKHVAEGLVEPEGLEMSGKTQKHNLYDEDQTHIVRRLGLHITGVQEPFALEPVVTS